MAENPNRRTPSASRPYTPEQQAAYDRSVADTAARSANYSGVGRLTGGTVLGMAGSPTSQESAQAARVGRRLAPAGVPIQSTDPRYAALEGMMRSVPSAAPMDVRTGARPLMADVQGDPRGGRLMREGFQAQMAALNQGPVFGASQQRQMLEARNQAMGGAQGQRMAALEALAARGMGGNSGAALMAQAAPGMGAADQMAAAGEAQTQALMRERMAALPALAQRASGLQQQTFAQDLARRSAMDEMARQNAERLQRADLQNVAQQQRRFENQLGMLERWYGTQQDAARAQAEREARGAENRAAVLSGIGNLVTGRGL